MATTLKANENTCDKCGHIMNTLDLIWLTTEDFTPRQDEQLNKEADKYDAVCEPCYQSLLKK